MTYKYCSAVSISIHYFKQFDSLWQLNLCFLDSLLHLVGNLIEIADSGAHIIQCNLRCFLFSKFQFWVVESVRSLSCWRWHVIRIIIQVFWLEFHNFWLLFTNGPRFEKRCSADSSYSNICNRIFLLFSFDFLNVVLASFLGYGIRQFYEFLFTLRSDDMRPDNDTTSSYPRCDFTFLWLFRVI